MIYVLNDAECRELITLNNKVVSASDCKVPPSHEFLMEKPWKIKKYYLV